MGKTGGFLFSALLFLLAAGISYGAECGSVPTDGCTVTVRTTFTPGTYFLPNGITVKKSGITLDCNQSTLLGVGNRTGIRVNGGFQNKVEQSTIKNCIVKNYGDGIHLVDGDGKTQYNNITDNYLINNTNDIFINTWVKRNKIWRNTIHSRIYYQYSNENNYCVDGVGNDYIGNATGPTCKGFYPYNGMGILSDISLLPGTYYLPSGMTVWTDGITVECNNATLIGKGAYNGIKLFGYAGWGANYNTIKNCNIENYSIGINVDYYTSGASFNNITNNSFRSNNRDVYISSGNNYNRVWDNTITSSVYYTSISTQIYCVDGVGNNYIGNATGPTCGGMYLYDSLVLFSSPVVLPGVYKIPKGISFFDGNLTLDCRNATLIGDGTGNGITIDSDWTTLANNIKIINCNFRNYSNGIFMGPYPKNNIITGNSFYNNTNDIFLKQRWNPGQLNVGFNKIWDNLITSRIYYLFSDDNQYCINGTGNMYIGDATGPTCDGFYPYDGLKVNSNIKLLNRIFKLPNGIELFRNRTLDCNNATLLGSGQGTGVILNSPSHAKLANCNIGNYSNGTLLPSGSTLGPLTNNTITGNTFFNNTNDILVKYASNNTIVNNTIHSRIYYPYYFSNIYCSEGYGNRYGDNATGPTCEGIYLYNGLSIYSSVMVIPGQYSLPDGIRVEGSGLDCQNAVLSGNGSGAGISVFISYRNNASRISNCIVKNYTIGINVLEIGFITVNNNNTLVGNSVFNNTLGIVLDDRTHNTTVLNNLIINNTYGISVWGQSPNSWIKLNTIANNRYGIYTEERMINVLANNIFGNSIYNLYNKQGLSLNATHNWWNSLSPAEIDAAIYDDEESGGIRGEVNFSSWLLDAVGSCNNGYKDEQEGDIDCGGSCRVCSKDQACNAGSDCRTGFCSRNGKCAAPSCFDSEKNGAEEGIDCGWACLNPCGTCHGVKVNGDGENKIDVVFVGSGFSDANQWIQAVEEFIDYDGVQDGLMSEEPFASKKARFNFWAVTELENFSDDGSGHQPYEAQAKTAAASHCPQIDQMVLLSVKPRFIPHAYSRPFSGEGGKYAFLMAGCEYVGACSFPLDIANPSKGEDPTRCQGSGSKPECSVYGNTRAQLRRTFLHEFGHSFGGLYDEYDFGSSTAFPPFRIPNCDGSDCSKWSSLNSTGCFPGCGYTNWYRAYDNTIMRNQYDLASSYGEVNRRELEKDINASAKGPFGILSLEPESYNLSFLIIANYSMGNASIAAVSLSSGSSSPANAKDGQYIIRVISFSNRTLSSVNFSFNLEAAYAPPLDWFDANGTQNSTPDKSAAVLVNETTEAIPLPYYPDGERVEIANAGNALITSFNISAYHDMDGDMLPAIADNCPMAGNSGQDDADGNEIGDACQIQLSKGWSLISFPSKPNNATIAGGMEGIPINWAKPPIAYFGGRWIRVTNSSSLDGASGFFINALEGGNFSLAGAAFDSPANISIQKGWNLVGYPSGRSSNVNESLENVSAAKVFSFQAGRWLSFQKGRNSTQNTLQNFTPGFGYWVFSENASSWMVGK
ncbi:hypothetical protein HYU14_01720 [Candidatus Woesearchaeota archaeon]|nr:hypothetical protein [Candidatus Woesearchaeota archaeon]